MLPLLVLTAMPNRPDSLDLIGQEVRLHLERANAEIIERFYVKDKAGKEHLILVSPTAPGLPFEPTTNLTAYQPTKTKIYVAAPTFRFTDFKTDKTSKTVTLESKTDQGDFTKTIEIPTTGHEIKVILTAQLKAPNPSLGSLLLSYAFTPDGKPLTKGGKPDSTFLPGIRPKDDNVVGDHFFRAPAAIAQQGPLAALILPDLDVLKDNRPTPTILDLDCKNGVVDAPLLTYGFAHFKWSGHVYYSTVPTPIANVPQTLNLAETILLNADAEPHAAYAEANKYSWDKYGHPNLDKILPQAMPFADYAKYCYPAAFSEFIGDNKLGWFEQDINGKTCGGIPAGWGYDQGLVSWQCWFNNLRSGYGLRKWGQKLNNADWVQKADKMLNLALAAPLDKGACPTTYNSRKKEWVGCLMQPDNPVGKAYYDLPNMAWKGIWLLRWANDFKDCPRRGEILDQCRQMADCMMREQNTDGSIPSWLTQDQKLVPVLDHSAQTALPAWFLFNLSEQQNAPAGFNEKAKAAALKAADFLSKQVVDGQYYYDFETFFSCSAKACTQINGTVDNEAMRDPHTLQPPQNTLSMQWTAEALRAAYHATKSKPYLTQALKALEKMDLYQVVWPISYRHAAYTYGGFGVQNSDGEYNDARQAQFGETLCDFGAELNRKDLFERGVAATRASLTLINHPLHDEAGIYPAPNYPPGLEPENTGHNGDDEQDGRTGFDWGEGSGLTTMAILLDKYGDAYDGGTWRVGINGVAPTPSGYAQRMLSDVAGNLDKGSQIEIVHAAGTRVKAQASLYPRTVMFASLTDGKPSATIAFFGIKPSDFQGDLVSDSGDRIKAIGGTDGTTLTVPLPANLQGRRLHLEGAANGIPIQTDPQSILFDPAFDFSPTGWSQWKIEGAFPAPFSHPTRKDFGLPQASYTIGTAEDGHGGFQDAYRGRITSPPFVVTKPSITLMVGGGSGEGEFVELVDYLTGQQLAIARGANNETLTPVTWDTTRYKNHTLVIRIIDYETTPWGHINVANIRCQ